MPMVRAFLSLLAVLAACSGRATERAWEAHEKSMTDKPDKITKTEEEWRAQLTPEEYRIAREKGTERAFTGKYWDSKKEGTYACACCGQPLFASDTKFKSGTGWPSFYRPVEQNNVDLKQDSTLFMKRTEVTCSRCDAHLGHVFDDGPDPTGLRYCLNSASLDLVDKE